MQKKTRKIYFIYILTILFIIVFYSLMIENCNNICILDDEFGYWSGAAYFYGLDWSVASATCPYYGYGYGILLTPILAIFHFNSTVMYKVALYLNIVLVIIMFHCIITILSRLNVRFEIAVLMSSICVLFPSVIIYVQVTLCETLITCIIWIMVLLLQNIKSKNSTWQWGILFFLAFYLFAIHQRTITVLLSLCLVYAFYIHDSEIKKAKIIQLIMLILVLGLATIVIKRGYADYLHMYTQEINPAYIDNNDFAYRIEHLLSSINLSSVKVFVETLMGKTFMSFVSTLGLLPFGIVYCCKIIKKYICRTDKISSIYSILFVLINFVLALALSVETTAYFPNEVEKMLYSRYTDYVMYPLIMFGMLYVYNCQNRLSFAKQWSFIAIIMILLTIGIYKNINNGDVLNVWCKLPTAAAAFFKGESEFYEVILLWMLENIAISLFILGIYIYIQTNRSFKIMFLIMCCYFLYNGYLITIHTADWHQMIDENYPIYVEIAEQLDNGKTLVTYECQERIEFIQFNFPLHKLTRIAEYKDITEDMIIITNINDINKVNNEQNNIICQSDLLVLWEKK